MKIAALGNSLVDVLIKLTDDSLIQKLNLPKGSMQLINADQVGPISAVIESYSKVMVSGGSAANTIHGLAKLGERCSFIGKVGNDEYGKFYDYDLKNAGVNSILSISKTETGRAFTFITPDSERTFATYLGAAVELELSDLNNQIFKGLDIFHIEGYLVPNKELVEAACKMAKNIGAKISLDMASYNIVEENRKFLSQIILKYIDIVFANEEEAKAYTGKAPTEALNEIASQCDIAVVKVGKDGSLIKQAGSVAKINAVPSNVIDTTGAGDQFAAGFLHGYSEHQEIEQCGKIGAIMAGAVIANYGARIPDNLWGKLSTDIQRILE